METGFDRWCYSRWAGFYWLKYSKCLSGHQCCAADYCDLLIRDYELRVAIQAAYLRSNGDSEYSKYETFLEKQAIKDTEWWMLRRAAMLLSSLVICFSIGCVSAFQWNSQSSFGLLWRLPIVTAFVGSIAVIRIQILYAAKRQSILQAPLEE